MKGLLHNGLACKSPILKTLLTCRFPCHRNVLPPASFFPPADSCLQDDRQLLCGFSEQILHFSIFFLSSYCLEPLFLFGFALCLEGVLGCQHRILPNVCQHPTLQNVRTCGNLTAHCLGIASSMQGKEGAGSSVPAQPAQGRIWQSPQKAALQLHRGGVASLNQSQPRVAAGLGSQGDILAIQAGRGLRSLLCSPLLKAGSALSSHQLPPEAEVEQFILMAKQEKITQNLPFKFTPFIDGCQHTCQELVFHNL